jgi:hypothetical protein
VVGLVRPDLPNRGPDRIAVGQLELSELDPLHDALRRTEDGAEHLIAMPEQQLSEVGAVLPADPGDERAPRHRAAP